MGLLQTFKTKAFARFANREGLDELDLLEVVERAATGVIDADLGGGVIKQRVPRKGGGRSSGYRAIILYRKNDLAIFVYGYAKSDRSTVRPDELASFRLLADTYFGLDESSIAAAQSAGAIIEVSKNGEEIQK
ncbi:MAG: type II toxin-antitoxin system RelE/ParE family toxin [Gammaproteobacteria bacterium]|nr:type II toxin-antitoxin system RelE/ParE family toxin [Gammaproteobacteria bacterium]